MKYKRLLLTGIITSCYLLSGCGTSSNDNTNQNDDLSSSLINDSSVEDSSDEEDSSEDPNENLEEEELDAATLLNNIKGMTSYSFTYATTNTQRHITSEMLEVSKTTTIVKTDGKNYETSGSYETRRVGTLKSFSTYYGMSESSVLSMIQDSENMRYDRATEKYTVTRTDKIAPILFQHNDDVGQYMEYSIHNGRAVSGYYLPYINGLMPYYVTTDLIEEIAKNGTPNIDRNTVTYTVTDEALENDNINYILSALSSPSSITLQITNNYPSKIVIHPPITSNPNSTYEEVDQSVELIYSNINNTTLIQADPIAPCSHHGKATYVDNDYHRDYCPVCGIYLNNGEPHDYDEQYGVCKECGFVEGKYSSEMKKVIDLGNDYYIKAYEDAKGHLLMPLMVMKEANGKTVYGTASSYGGNMMYDQDAKAVAICFETINIPVPNSKCVSLLKRGYHIYKDIPFDDNGYLSIDGKNVEDYLIDEGIEPDATVYCYESERNHNVHTTNNTTNCIHETAYSCSACGESHYEVNVKPSHSNLTNFERITAPEFYAEFSRSPHSLNYSSSYYDNDSYFKAHCEGCGKDVYVRTYGTIDEDHALRARNYTICEKDGMVPMFSDYYEYIPHMEGSDGHCIFCNKNMHENGEISVYVNGINAFSPYEYQLYPDPGLTTWIYDDVQLHSGDVLSIYVDGQLITPHGNQDSKTNYIEGNGTQKEFTVYNSGTCYLTLYLYQGEYYFDLFQGSRYSSGGNGGSSSSGSSYPESSSEWISSEDDSSEDEAWDYDNSVIIEDIYYSLNEYENSKGRRGYYIDGLYLSEGDYISFYIDGSLVEFYLEYEDNEEYPVPNCQQTSTSTLYNYVNIKDTVDNGYIYLYDNENGTYSAYIGPRTTQDPGNIHYYDYQYVLYNVTEHRVIAGLEYSPYTDYQGRQQYTATDVELHYGDVIQLYDTSTQIGWITPIDSFSLENDYESYITTNDSNSWRILDSMTVDIYAKFKINDDQVYLQLK